MSQNYFNVTTTSIDLPLQSSSYQRLFALIADPVIVFDPLTYEILEVNDIACETYFLRRENFVGRSIKDLWIDSDNDPKIFETLSDDDSLRRFETVHLRSDGFRMNIIVNCSLIETGDKKVILAVNRNVTEQRRAEEGMKLATIEWRDTVDAVPDMIILEDGNGNLRRCNRVTSEFLGRSYEEIIGRPMSSLFPISRQTNDGFGAESAETNFKHLRLRNWEGRFNDYDQWFEVNNCPITSKLKSETRWVHVIKNITNRKLDEEQIRKFFTVVEQASSPIYITDLKGKIQYVNFLVEELSGMPKDFFIGKTIFEVNSNLSVQTLIDEIVPALAKNKLWQKHVKTKRDNELLLEEITVSTVKDDQDNDLNYVFICRDVTETRQLESIAEAVNMMDNVGYIFSGIRHELGNPINSVKMALTVLEKNLDKWDKEQVSVYVNRCLSEISRVEYLLRTLKSFSLHENPQMEINCLVEFMQGFVSFIKGDFERRGIKIHLDSKIETAKAWCDTRALHQVMLNLIANAADALENKENAEILISIDRLKNRLQVSIEDNGTGMNEKQLRNSFKPFYTSKPNGTGLGLVIVHKMLVKMNGTISIESVYGAGTKVIFTLEAAENDDF